MTVCEWEDGRVEIEYRGQKLPWKEIASRPTPASAAAGMSSKHKPWIPPRKHPWRSNAPGLFPELKLLRESKSEIYCEP